MTGTLVADAVEASTGASAPLGTPGCRVHRVQERGDPEAAADAAAEAEVTVKAPETVQTTATHPWRTVARGWVPAGALQVGERVRRLDGGTATVVAVRAVAGRALMYTLTVSQVHTFAVGVGRYVVHNTCGPVKAGDAGPYGDLVAQAKKYGTVGNLEFHHVPQDALHFLPRNAGWAIAMESWEHVETRTYRWAGRITKAQDAAKPLREVFMEDARNIRSIVGTKYDDAIYRGFLYYIQLGLW